VIHGECLPYFLRFAIEAVRITKRKK